MVKVRFPELFLRLILVRVDCKLYIVALFHSMGLLKLWILKRSFRWRGEKREDFQVFQTQWRVVVTKIGCLGCGVFLCCFFFSLYFIFFYLFFTLLDIFVEGRSSEDAGCCGPL